MRVSTRHPLKEPAITSARERRPSTSAEASPSTEAVEESEPANQPNSVAGNGFYIALFVAMHLAALFVFVFEFSWALVGLCAATYAVRIWAITAGYHRYFAHRSYKTSRAFQFVMAFLGASALQQGPLWWASWHRHHHRYSDEVEDLHSPRHGFWWSHVGWFFDRRAESPPLRNVKDLSRYPELVWLDRHWRVPSIVLAVICFAIAGWPGLAWGWFLSSVLVIHSTSLVNSLAHLWGTRPYETTDTSRNNVLIALLTFGEGWHNNHHHCMRSVRQGFHWWQIDISYYSLVLLSYLRVVWDLRTPNERELARDRAPEPSVATTRATSTFRSAVASPPS
jgi:stearoyl-CoA desaturase (delta-9 desaturase)